MREKREWNEEILTFLENKADEIRKEVVEVCVNNGAGHIAPSLSIVDVLVYLYYYWLRLPETAGDAKWDDRDRVVFSKAHGGYALYAILADLGFIPGDHWKNFYKDSPLAGCVERNEQSLLEASTGSLGHGLPLATGMAFGAGMQNKEYRVVCVLGDGETQEGTTWEALQFASRHQLSNLVIVLDKNRLQAMDFLDNVLTRKGKDWDLEEKFTAFGCDVRHCHGHTMSEIHDVFEEYNSKSGMPFVISAETVKGYGLYCMEDIAKFHFRLPTREELELGNRYD